MGKTKYGIRITPRAYNDLDDIYSYLAGESMNEEAGIHLMDRIETSILRLKDFPMSGSYVNDDILKNRGYRKLLVDNYIVFYLVDESENIVVIMRVLYGRQKYQDFL